MRLDGLTHFVLLDDARADDPRPARLYRNPVGEISASNAAEIDALFDQLRAAQAKGLHAAGYVSYEAGHAIEPKLRVRTPETHRLAWFGLYAGYEEIASEAVAQRLPDGAGAILGPLIPELSQDEYVQNIEMLLEEIRAGTIYQANFTFRAEVDFVGHPLAVYAKIRDRARAGHGGIVHDGSRHLLSFSPELFFALKDGRISTRPMKGTAARLSDLAADRNAADRLQTDTKQRAENLMIVDLMRNDLSRICLPGSVQVSELFHVETYPTVHQLVSNISGQLVEGEDAVKALRALFPCGSITGAPKISAMQIIDDLEHSRRDVYCGAIGRIDANGDAAFNVAIRTFSTEVSQTGGRNSLCLGLGSGIVADSTAAEEWAECLTKGEFARMDDRVVDLIETMRFEPAEGIVRLEAHLGRMKASASTLGYEFDRHAARNMLNAACFHIDAPSRIRFLSSAKGSQAIEIAPIPDAFDEPLRVAIVPLPVEPHDFRLSHKTSDRAFYDEARQVADADEVVFADAKGYLTEGSFTSLFVEREGMLITPPLSRGLLPGVLRGELIEQGRATEGDLTADDLNGGFLLGNSLRGLMKAKLI